MAQIKIAMFHNFLSFVSYLLQGCT